MKYKVGDRVRVRSDLKAVDSYKIYGVGTNKEMERMAGKIVTIDSVGSDCYKVKECNYVWTDKMFEGYAGKITKEELFNMPIGTKIITDKGKEFVFDEEFFTNEDALIYDYNIDDSLNLIDDSYYGTKIVKVLEPEYKTVWKEVPKKMTLKEIEELVGGPVEIVEEK